ncbi:MAG: FAD:protein FMN transferase [Saccharospirillaceae bacterium]|nr:FAD:protein FMN transferase [Pseudomonadales bacterium]NRB80540.1 FAD:protein FMN transferase [Saccharospirillaceae bacterium]
MKKLSQIWKILTLVSLCSILISCQSKKEQVINLEGKTMGQVSYRVLVVTKPSEQQSIHNGIESKLDEIVQLMSTYVSDSQVSQFNDLEINKAFKVDPKTFEVLTLSQLISEQTDGAFDITVGPLVDLWGFGPKARPEQIPDPMQIKQSFQLIGFAAIKLNIADVSVLKQKYRRIDLSAIAKGYAVDEIARYLDSQLVSAYMIEVGGEIRLKGLKPNGEKWRIAIEKPQTGFTQQILTTLVITDISMATSGDYRNFFEVDGVRFSHTIDPKTGYPIAHNLASVTVLNKDCATADALATALMVMGEVDAVKFANEKNIAAFFIIKTDDGFKQVSSKSYKILTNEK